MTIQVTTPALHGEGRTADGGEIATYRSSSGAQAESAISGDRLKLDLSGKIEVGESGVPEVVGVLRATLAANGREVRTGREAQNRDDDARLSIDGHDVPIQVVTVPSEPSLWAELARGSATTDVPIALAATWVRDAITAKARQYPDDLRKDLILAIDARFVPVLPSAAVVASYLSQFPDPTVASGFAAVWLVGPRESRCTQLGNGKW
jgi:hypothetical protein